MTAKTAVVLIDPYNEFLHPDGKLYHKVAKSLVETNTVAHMKELVDAARANHIPIFYCYHQQVDAGSYDHWNHMTNAQKESQRNKVFTAGTFGTQTYSGLEPDRSNGDVVVSKHWSWSSFENTDLEFQLRQRDIVNLVIAGMETSACVESTGRIAYERGFQITMLTDATAAFTTAAKEATVNYVWPIFANNVQTVGEWAAGLEVK